MLPLSHKETPWTPLRIKQVPYIHISINISINISIISTCVAGTVTLSQMTSPGAGAADASCRMNDTVTKCMIRHGMTSFTLYCVVLIIAILV